MSRGPLCSPDCLPLSCLPLNTFVCWRNPLERATEPISKRPSTRLTRALARGPPLMAPAWKLLPLSPGQNVLFQRPRPPPPSHYVACLSFKLTKPSFFSPSLQPLLNAHTGDILKGETALSGPKASPSPLGYLTPLGRL